MTLQIQLHDNTQLTVSMEGYNSAQFTSMLNDPKLTFIAIGDASLNKNIIKLVIPVKEG